MRRFSIGEAVRYIDVYGDASNVRNGVVIDTGYDKNGRTILTVKWLNGTSPIPGYGVTVEYPARVYKVSETGEAI